MKQPAVAASAAVELERVEMPTVVRRELPEKVFEPELALATNLRDMSVTTTIVWNR